MAIGPIKTEMTGTGGGRWGPRATIKRGADKLRRRNDRAAVAEGLNDWDDELYDEYDDDYDDDWYDDLWDWPEDDWYDEVHECQSVVIDVFNSLLTAVGADCEAHQERRATCALQ